jgi:hypothetical protein
MQIQTKKRQHTDRQKCASLTQGKHTNKPPKSKKTDKRKTDHPPSEHKIETLKHSQQKHQTSQKKNSRIECRHSSSCSPRRCSPPSTFHSQEFVSVAIGVLCFIYLAIKLQAKQDAYGTTAQCSIALGPQLIGQWQHQPGES